MTDPTYIAEIFGGPSQAIDAYSSLLQKISDQFTVSPSEQVKVTYKELVRSVSGNIGAGSRWNALRSENGVEVTGSPSELRWPLVCVGVVMGPSLPKFMVIW